MSRREDGILVSKSERRRLVHLLHSTHMFWASMWDTSRNIRFWAKLKYKVHVFDRDCQICRTHDISKMCTKQVIPDDVTTVQPLDHVGVDLFDLEGLDYICKADKASGFRFIENIRRRGNKKVCEVFEQWFSRYAIPNRLHSNGGPRFRADITSWLRAWGYT